MTDTAIRVDNLSKMYHIGAAQQRHDTLRDALTALFQRNGRGAQQDEILWALKDISFNVKRGEVVGVIGRNGAGKSTLLKILSRITEPTIGSAEIRGRVGSLLEVGTGFHPELTGRENVYLNGAILGMKRAEIDRKFDEIVAFSEIDRFLDTPVKRYSSGMYVRLAFAVAAHLEPEILIIDEVLAVGDMAFQKKCLGKMGDVAKEGRTVLFVSHNMVAVQALCTRAFLIDRGRIVAEGNTNDVVNSYLRGTETVSQSRPTVRQDSPYLRAEVAVDGAAGDASVIVQSGEPFRVDVVVHCGRPALRPRIDIACYCMDGLKLFAVQSDRFLAARRHARGREWHLTCDIGGVPITSQYVYLDIGVRRHYMGEYELLWKRACTINIAPSVTESGVTADSLLAPKVEVSMTRN